MSLFQLYSLCTSCQIWLFENTYPKLCLSVALELMFCSRLVLLLQSLFQRDRECYWRSRCEVSFSERKQELYLRVWYCSTCYRCWDGSAGFYSLIRVPLPFYEALLSLHLRLYPGSVLRDFIILADLADAWSHDLSRGAVFELLHQT